MTDVFFKTREQWLEAAAELLLAQVFVSHPDIPLPRVSVGFGPRLAKRSLGWCVYKACAADGRPQIYITPRFSPHDLDGPQGVLATLTHEMCHGALPDGSGHGKKFAALAEAVGLEGPWTCTQAGPDLQTKLAKIAAKLGPFPHAEIEFAEKDKKQTTRMLKCSCGECGYVIRTTKVWLDEKGPPLCPCNRETMQREGDE
jgi:hypothetical protein